MKEIGGYFELELKKEGYHYHDTPHALKSGRAALHHMLDHLKPSLVYLPFYTCDALLEPLKEANIPYEFYPVNDKLEPVTLIDLREGEYFLYIDYFGLKK